MLVTVFCAPRDRPEITFSLDVSPELEVRDFVALCELESGIPAAEIQISYAEQPLQDPTRALGTYGLKDGDVVVLRQAERRPPPPQPAFPGLPRIDFSSIAVPGTSSGRRPPSQQHRQSQNTQERRQQQQPQQPEQAPVPPPPPSLTGSASSPQGLDDPSLLREMLLANPHELSLLKERNPPLAEALLSGDLERFTKVLLEQQQERARREQERIRLLTADPFDLEAQAKIEEDIRQHNIEENMTIAMEEAPESFGQVVMLYINCKVNGHPVKAFVDSGAQMTIMSQACAERCNIMRLVDRRWAGIAKGVGTQKIIGRVHLAQVQIEGDFLPCSFSILEDQPMDMLLGLDMLKRHQCSIDLKKSVLLIGTTGSETRFLPEAELPECARLAYGADSREDARPEEIADRELAEALQRSVQESDTEDGQTTSPPVQPCPLSPPSDRTSLLSSPSPGHTQNPALDRSQSAPASLLPHPPQGASASGSSQSHPPFHGLPGPAPPVPATPETPEPEAPPQAPPPPTAGPSPLPLPLPPPASLDLPTSAPKVSMNTEDAESLAPTAMEVGGAGGGGGAGSPALPPPSHPEPSTLQTGRELEETQSADAKNTHACVSGEPDRQEEEEEEEEEGRGVEMDAVCGGRPCSAPRDPKLEPGLGLHGEDLASQPRRDSGPSSHLAMDTPLEAQATPPAERDQPEGEQQPNFDTIPSLAAALKELHQLLVANKHMLSQERSPTPSPSPSPACREDADGVDDGPAARSQPARAPTRAAETGAAGLESAPVPLPARSAGSQCSSSYAGSPGGGEAEAMDGEKACGDSEAGGEQMEDVERRAGPEPEASAPPQQDLELREPPEGQLGRGVADGRAVGPSAPDPLPSPMEVAPPNAPPAAASPPCAAPATPDEDPCVPPRVSRPLPPSSSSAAPPPRAPSDRFPAAHIQKIQAAGFSASEAAEALEQVQGHVELALLMLLARKITVPS